MESGLQSFSAVPHTFMVPDASRRPDEVVHEVIAIDESSIFDKAPTVDTEISRRKQQEIE